MVSINETDSIQPAPSGTFPKFADQLQDNGIAQPSTGWDNIVNDQLAVIDSRIRGYLGA